MRAIGLLLVVVGGLVLGYQGLVEYPKDGSVGSSQAPASGGIISVPPVASGIAVVSGLLVLASARRSED